MPGHKPCCPVCGVSKSNKNTGRIAPARGWYAAKTYTELLDGHLDETLAALSCNDHFCPRCYMRLMRQPPAPHDPPPPHDPLDDLIAATDEHHPPPPLSPQQPLPPPPAPPSPPPPPLPPPPHTLPSTPVSRSSSLRLPPVSSSTHLIPRRSWSLTEKARICREWDAATSHVEKQAVRDKYRAPHLDGGMIARRNLSLHINAESPKKKKAAGHAVRVKGSGSLPALTQLPEQKIDDWIMNRRRQLLRVLVNQIKILLQVSTNGVKMANRLQAGASGPKGV